MAGAKEIRTQIGSIKNTQKITRAMEMVAAAKMRKAQDRMHASRPYAEKMRTVIGHLAMAHPQVKHPFMEQREVKSVGYIIVSSDRGLCGGLNNNMFRQLVKGVQKLHEDDIAVRYCLVGSKAVAFFSRVGGDVLAQATQLGEAAHMEDLVGTVKVMLDAYIDGEVDEIRIAYNRFVNTMTQEPIVDKLVPLPEAEETEEAEKLKHHWDYIYEPEAQDVLADLLARYVESLAYQAVVENSACEQSARMVAMKAASDNAGSLIDELELVYNKARQAAITQEISEIVSGAAAV
ncbi:MAG TPA: F0F1 ATP synthase subunit gamma [Thiolapillus brandeum]|uniref:ATP synthase gamma chain n=1 Tax=Thiolapillus brandeum TaxID=1076588 RepID=A0A831KCD5_9GAMM|nr:F0F1 ATP synthase subunit gamma [Thiolapillus brandeum]